MSSAIKSISMLATCLFSICSALQLNSCPRIYIFETYKDLKTTRGGQIYSPPPTGIVSSSENNFGITPYPYFAVTECKGLVYVTGGAYDLHKPTDRVQLFEPDHDIVTNIQPMDIKRSLHSMACLNEMPVVCGGYGNRIELLSACEIYNTSTKNWVPLPAMPYSVAEHKATVLDGILYVAGGLSSMGGQVSPLIKFDPQTNKWTRLSSMIDIRQNTFGLVALPSRNELLTCGDLNSWKKCEVYNVTSGAWSQAASLAYARIDFGMVLFEDRVLVFGGKCKESQAYLCPNGQQDYMTVVEQYDVDKGDTSVLSLPLYSHTASYASAFVP